jgi:hypothetical protein
MSAEKQNKFEKKYILTIPIMIQEEGFGPEERRMQLEFWAGSKDEAVRDFTSTLQWLYNSKN